MNDKLISIVIPMYFENQVADECYTRLSNVALKNDLNYELIFINDGSTDNTLEILEGLAKKDPHVKVISFSRNFGHQIAVTAGINKAKGDAVVIIDADLQDPPELIPHMIKLWQQGNDVVYGKRKKREGESPFKIITAKLFYRILNKMSSVEIPADTGDFRLIDRKVAEAMKKMPEHNRFLRGMSSWVGFKQIPLEYERKERFAGETKYPLKKMIKFAEDGIFSFSSKPLKLVQHLGFHTILISFITFIYLMTKIFSGTDRSSIGWITTLTISCFIGGIQLASIGIVGEYIARIYDESKSRPLYIVDKEINLDDNAENPLNNSSGKINLYKTTQRALYLVNHSTSAHKNYNVK
ncbi:MAG: glycosyl transferase family 2 [Clostridiaceae bacterium]|nr:glycosyl transferase family 2 [Clostridiaceae bacterium]